MTVQEKITKLTLKLIIDDLKLVRLIKEAFKKKGKIMKVHVLKL